MITNHEIQRPETVLFVGAGATARLKMPTTGQMAKILWHFCDKENLTGNDIHKVAGLPIASAQIIADMLNVTNNGFEGERPLELDESVRMRAFPGIGDDDLRKLLLRLRSHYDFGALQLVALAKKGGSESDDLSETYLQEVFTLFDACIRDNRGFTVYRGNREIFLSVARLCSGRETLVLLVNTLFACAWHELYCSTEDKANIERYRQFFCTLARLMQQEGCRFEAAGCRPNYPEFYQLSYAVVTTNFEPLFLWFIWNAHAFVNHGNEIRVGNPGRKLKLLLNFPNTLGMRKPNDVDDLCPLSSDIWFPCTDAAAQNVNSLNYQDNRLFRIGKYYAVHGMSNARQCPVCGRLNLYMGDTWDKESKSLFTNGIVSRPDMQQPRTDREKAAHRRGEYDALECHFCGAMTYSYDNFMYMQTQLKALPPSFIKETTDEALSVIAGAKHIVLLGYSLPLDDVIWGSMFTVMSRRREGERLYCSVVGFDKEAPDHWLSGEELRTYVKENSERQDDYEKIRGVRNAITVFGLSNVRAYMKGVPDVFKDGTEQDVLELMYPTDVPNWRIDAFSTAGVIRSSIRKAL